MSCTHGGRRRRRRKGTESSLAEARGAGLPAEGQCGMGTAWHGPHGFLLWAGVRGSPGRQGTAQALALVAAAPAAALLCVCPGRESRQDFLSAALAPGLITNQAVEVYPFIVEENYLHNTTRRNLYLALFPWRDTGQSGGAQKCGFGPNTWEVNPDRLGVPHPACAGSWLQI